MVAKGRQEFVSAISDQALTFMRGLRDPCFSSNTKIVFLQFVADNYAISENSYVKISNFKFVLFRDNSHGCFCGN